MKQEKQIKYVEFELTKIKLRIEDLIPLLEKISEEVTDLRELTERIEQKILLN